MTYQSSSPGELAHYGVKGMKWGVRRDRDSSTESKALRKESRRNLNDYMWNAIADEPIWGKTMTQSEYKALSTKGETFVKNTTFRRVTPNSETTVKGRTYVSTLMKDSDFYRAAIPSVGPNSKGKGGGLKEYKQKHYEIEMKATKKLSSPSEKERVDAFIELLEEPSVKVKGKNAPITGRAYLEKMGYKPLFKRYETQQLAFESWDGFTRMQGDQDNPLAKAYFDKIKSRGYNALIDDNDRGRFTDKPVVLLDPESTVTIKNVKQLTTDEINQAQRRLQVPD